VVPDFGKRTPRQITLGFQHCGASATSRPWVLKSKSSRTNCEKTPPQLRRLVPHCVESERSTSYISCIAHSRNPSSNVHSTEILSEKGFLGGRTDRLSQHHRMMSTMRFGTFTWKMPNLGRWVGISLGSATNEKANTTDNISSDWCESLAINEGQYRPVSPLQYSARRIADTCSHQRVSQATRRLHTIFDYFPCLLELRGDLFRRILCEIA
jgi:hypothetical protein